MDTTRALSALQALAQPTRLGVFRLLVAAGPDGIAAGEIARRMGVVQNTMSAHLAQLADAGLVSARRDGRSVVYALDVAGTRALLAFLVEDCCGGRPELCAPALADLACPC